MENPQPKKTLTILTTSCLQLEVKLVLILQICIIPFCQNNPLFQFLWTHKFFYSPPPSITIPVSSVKNGLEPKIK